MQGDFFLSLITRNSSKCVVNLVAHPVEDLFLPRVTNAVSESPVNSLFIDSSIVLPEV